MKILDETINLIFEHININLILLEGENEDFRWNY